MASAEAKGMAVTWCLTWFDAALGAAERICAADDPTDFTTEPDFLVFVTSVRNTIRSASVVLGPKHEKLRRFDERCPGLKELRDILEHHDDYLQGNGNLQVKRGRSAPVWFTPMLSGQAGETWMYAVLIELSDQHGPSPRPTVDLTIAVQEAAVVVDAVIDYRCATLDPERAARARKHPFLGRAHRLAGLRR